jgi:hypothetical protein
LLLQNEDNQTQSARLSRDAARDSFMSESKMQIEALHAAADATASGAALSAAISIAGGACSVAGALDEYDANTAKAELSGLSCQSPTYLEDSRVLNQAFADSHKSAQLWGASANAGGALAGPAKTLVGDCVAEGEQATAKHHETLAEQARWTAGDASETIDKAGKRSDSELQILQGIQNDEHSSNNAIIGRI